MEDLRPIRPRIIDQSLIQETSPRDMPKPGPEPEPDTPTKPFMTRARGFFATHKVAIIIIAIIIVLVIIVLWLTWGEETAEKEKQTSPPPKKKPPQKKTMTAEKKKDLNNLLDELKEEDVPADEAPAPADNEDAAEEDE